MQGLSQASIHIHKIFRVFLIIILTFISSLSLFAQNSGSIKGIIVDADFGDVLIGANVFIKGSTKGAASDINGNYSITNITPGTYSLTFSMIGFQKKTVTEIEVKSGETVKIDIVLDTETYQVEEVIILAKAVINTEASLLAKRQKSISLSDAVSSEHFEKMGSSNAADAVKQIVGATVVNGKDVFVRGLGDRYTSTNLNGAQIPSANPYKRSGSIDIIPSSLIDNIQAIKSFTPDKPGDFSGGAIDIKTKDFPEKFNMSLSASSAYNSSITFNKNGLAYKGGSTDWLGYDNGSRKLTSMISEKTWISNVGAGQTDDKIAQQIHDVTNSFNSEMVPVKQAPPMNQSYTFSVGRQFQLFGKQIGFIGSLSYKNQYSGYINGEINRWDRGVADPNKTQLDTNFAMTDTKSNSDVVLGGLFKTSIKLNEVNSISLNFLYNQNGESTSRFVNGKYPYDIDGDWNYQARTILYKERNLQSYQLDGNHSFKSLGALKIDWLASLMNSSQYDPDNRFFYNYETDQGVFGVKTNLLPERYFRETTESQNRFSLNFTYPFQVWNRRVSKVKFGGVYSKTDRAFNERRFVYNPVTSVGKYLRESKGDVNDLFSAKNLGWTSKDTLSNGRIVNRFSLYINETDQTSSNYSGTNEIVAYYGMIELPVSKTIRVITGARFESTNMSVVSAKKSIPNSEIITKDILPSLGVLYNPIKNMNFRFSYGRTLARPNFREISSFQNYEFNGGDTYIGNPSLERTLIDNLDIRWEWFTNPGEVLSISLFTKKFTNPIELKIVDAPNKVLSWTNVDDAQVYGLEFESRNRMGFLSTETSNVQIGGNFSLIYSKVDIDPKELENIRIYEPNASSTRQFQGQSPYVINLYLDYENSDLEFTTSINYNVYGKRLASVGSLGTPDVFEIPTNLLNLTATKTLTSNFVIKLKIGNILNAKTKKVQEFKGKTYTYSSYLRGRRISLGLSYKI